MPAGEQSEKCEAVNACLRSLLVGHHVGQYFFKQRPFLLALAMMPSLSLLIANPSFIFRLRVITTGLLYTYDTKTSLLRK